VKRSHDVGWILIRQPIVAVGCVIAADMMGVAMMTPKVRERRTVDPHLPPTSRVFAKSPLTTRWLGRFDT
jgi:hypothetical protein